MKNLSLPRIDRLDLRAPWAFERDDRIDDDGGFDWDFPGPPQVPIPLAMLVRMESERAVLT